MSRTGTHSITPNSIANTIIIISRSFINKHSKCSLYSIAIACRPSRDAAARKDSVTVKVKVQSDNSASVIVIAYNIIIIII